MIKVIGVTTNDDFSLDLKFNDGSLKRFDFKPYLDYEVFRELRDPAYFKQVRLAFGTVQWPNQQDISPETLYLEGGGSKSLYYSRSSHRCLSGDLPLGDQKYAYA